MAAGMAKAGLKENNKLKSLWQIAFLQFTNTHLALTSVVVLTYIVGSRGVDSWGSCTSPLTGGPTKV